MRRDDQIRHLRSGDRPRRQRRLDARSVPGQHHPGGSHQSDGPGDHAVLAGSQRHDGRRGAVADRTCCGPSTSTRTCSGTGSGRSTTTSARTTGPSSAGARTSGTRSATGGNAIRERSRPGRPASALARQPRARRRLGAHLRAGHGLQPARQLHLFPGVELFRIRARFRFDGVLAREPRRPDAQPGDRRHLPGDRGRPVRDPVARHRRRTGTATTRFSRTCR